MATRKPITLPPGFKLVLFTVLIVYILLISVACWLGSYPALTPAHQKLFDWVMDSLKVGTGAIFGLLGGLLTQK
jgi:Na+-translocating ferredoxin:NAD+ oxidoreductase RnfE subunit